MKRIIFSMILIIGIKTTSYSQQISPYNLIGSWDQTSGSHPGRIIFEDSSRVSFSYKGHTGKTRSYYYLLNTTNTPTILTVDYSPSHKKHRNVYLIELTDKNTLKLQELYRKDPRDHFVEGKNSHFVTLSRKLEL